MDVVVLALCNRRRKNNEAMPILLYQNNMLY